MNITIQEIKDRKEKLERLIYDELVQFEKDTHLKVTHVNVHLQETSWAGTEVIAVKLDISL